MTEATETFDDLYRRWRDPLYRVVVLAVDDRDLALAAVDGGFAAVKAEVRRRPSAHPAPDVLRRAIAKAHKARRDAVRGFRLPDAAAGPEVASTVARLRNLDLTDRFVVLGHIYLGWDDAEVAHATGLATADVPTRLDAAMQAMTADDSDDPQHTDTRLTDAGLTAALIAAGDGISRPLSRLESVKSDARSKRVLRLTAAVAIVAALALGVAAVIPRLAGDDPSGPVAAGESPGNGSPDDPAATTTIAPIAVDAIEWVETGLPFRQGELTAVTAGPDGFVAIANDWSDPSGQSLKLLESDSGFEWTIADAPLGVRSGGYMSDLRYVDGRFVGIGNAFDEQAGTEKPLLVVTDEAGEWRTIEITTEDTIEVGDLSLDVSASMTSVAIDGDEIIAFGTQYAQEDLWPMIEDALPDGVDGNGGWGTSAAGIEIYNERGDVIFAATAEELGVPAEVLALMNSGAPSIWRSSDGGETWEQERVVGAFGRDAYVGQMATDGEKMLAVVQSGMGGALWSWEGEGWERVELGSGVSPTSIVRFEDRFYASGVSGTGGGMWSSEDGVAWEQMGGEAFAGMHTDRVSGSEFGLVAVGQSRPGGAGLGPAVIEKDDLTLTMDATGRYVVTDASGETLVDLFAEDLVRGPAGQVTFVDPDTETVLTVDQREIDQAWEAVFRQAEVGGPGDGPGAPAIAVSRNGVDWVRIDTAPLGTGFYSNTVALGPKALLVSGYAEGRGESGPALWVGELGVDPGD